MTFDISHVQYLHNGDGEIVAVQIPIKDWETIEQKMLDIPNWQKNILDERLNIVRTQSERLIDFDNAIEELENEED